MHFLFSCDSDISFIFFFSCCKGHSDPNAFWSFCYILSTVSSGDRELSGDAICKRGHLFELLLRVVLLRCPTLAGADEAADILTQHYLVPNLPPPTDNLLRAALLTTAVQTSLKRHLPLLHAAFRANSGVIAGTEPASSSASQLPGAAARLGSMNALAAGMSGLKLGGVGGVGQSSSALQSSSGSSSAAVPINSTEANKKRPLSTLAMNMTQFTNVLTV